MSPTDYSAAAFFLAGAFLAAGFLAAAAFLGAAFLAGASFDADLASVSPRTGLLRNSAIFRPAQNVFVQLGLIDEAGAFAPLDLNQPQALNTALAKQNNLPGASQSLTLGIRYVASRSLVAQNSGVQTASTGSQDVTAGNVSVFLPFLLKLN